MRFATRTTRNCSSARAIAIAETTHDRLFSRVAMIVVAFAILIASVSALRAGETWNDLKPDLFGDAPILDGTDFITLDAPNRPADQRKVPVSVAVKLADGRSVKSVMVVLDENPVPVAAVFEMGENRSNIKLKMPFRLGRETDVRAIVELNDGTLHMAARHIKFAGGQSACTAPPEGDPKEILANMGKMTLAHAPAPASVSQARPNAKLTFSHPNHTGMVLDPVHLYYTPMRMISAIDVRQGNEHVFTMTGSIAISQDPVIEFNYKVNGAEQLSVQAHDTDNTTWTHAFPINQGS